MYEKQLTLFIVHILVYKQYIIYKRINLTDIYDSVHIIPSSIHPHYKLNYFINQF